MEKLRIDSQGIDMGKSDQKIPWHNVMSFKPKSKVWELRTNDKRRFQIPMGGDQDAQLLSDFFRSWFEASPQKARKAIFDLVDTAKASSFILMFSILVALGGLSFIYLTDAAHTLQCDKLLKNGTPTQAEILKVKRTESGETRLTLKFSTLEGKVIEGKRISWLHSVDHDPKNPVDIVYSPENLSCWDLSNGGMPLLRRRFSLFFTGFFGIFSAISAICLTVFIVRRIKNYRLRLPLYEKIYQELGLK